MSSLQNLLENGIKCQDLSILLVHDVTLEMNILREDDNTGLSPLMLVVAAAALACGFDVTYMLAMKDVEKFLARGDC